MWVILDHLTRKDKSGSRQRDLNRDTAFITSARDLIIYTKDRQASEM